MCLARGLLLNDGQLALHLDLVVRKGALHLEAISVKIDNDDASDLEEEVVVDLKDNLHVPWQQVRHEAHVPLLERLGQHRMVRVGKDTAHRRPCLLPVRLSALPTQKGSREPEEALPVNEDAHELHNAERRVRVVELDAYHGRQLH